MRLGGRAFESSPAPSSGARRCSRCSIEFRISIEGTRTPGQGTRDDEGASEKGGGRREGDETYHNPLPGRPWREWDAPPRTIPTVPISYHSERWDAPPGQIGVRLSLQEGRGGARARAVTRTLLWKKATVGLPSKHANSRCFQIGSRTDYSGLSASGTSGRSHHPTSRLTPSCKTKEKSLCGWCATLLARRAEFQRVQ